VVDMQITLSKELHKKLTHFKKIFDVVMGKKVSWNEYANTVVSIGLNQMFRDSVPIGQEWNTILAMFKIDSEFTCNAIAKFWKGKATKETKQLKEKIKLTYIG
jgi:hypothetical protein